MKTFLILVFTQLSLIANAAPPPSTDNDFYREEDTGVCQDQVTEDYTSRLELLKLLKMKIIEINGNKLLYCNPNIKIPIIPACEVEAIGYFNEKVTLTPKYQLIYGKERWNYKAYFSGYELSVNTAPYFSDIDLKVTDLLTKTVKSTVEGVQRSSYYSTEESPFKFSVALERLKLNVTCKFVDKNPKTDVRR